MTAAIKALYQRNNTTVMHGSINQWDSAQEQASVSRKLMLMMQIMITEMLELHYLWSILIVEKVKEEQLPRANRASTHGLIIQTVQWSCLQFRIMAS